LPQKSNFNSITLASNGNILTVFFFFLNKIK
jgi:hypothetical protein